MSKPYPQEFRDDVVRVARNRDVGVTLAEVAHDFGLHPMTLSKWLRQAAIEHGDRPGVTTVESAKNRELEKRVRLLEQENEVLRRTTWSIRRTRAQVLLISSYLKGSHPSRQGTALVLPGCSLALVFDRSSTH